MTEQLGQQIGIRAACQALGDPGSSLYRTRHPKPEPEPRPKPDRALTPAEKAEVRQGLNSQRFQDVLPRQVDATLLEEPVQLCHWRTMDRILQEPDEVSERRRPVRRSGYVKPERLATRPNQLWSWDMTKLTGPVPWSYSYLYVILDGFSRYVVGWLLAEQEPAHLAERFIAESWAKQGLEPGQLTLHSDRGSPMKSKPVAQLLSDLGVTKSHSRPQVPDDNPFSEAQFKTLKDQPDFPERFASFSPAQTWARDIFNWYNPDFYHSQLG